nr:MAG TPA: hypothetical protein [Caudoviricetes sp.]
MLLKEDSCLSELISIMELLIKVYHSYLISKAIL